MTADASEHAGATAAPAARRLRGQVGAALLLIALGLLAVGWVARGSEQHSWVSGAVPPTYSHVTVGQKYTLSVPGGRAALTARGVAPESLACSSFGPGGARNPLTITAEPADGRAVNVVASFVAPVTGRLGVQCNEVGRVFLDDADDSDSDPSGMLLLVGIPALVAGFAVSLSALRETLASRAR